jgi:phosphatidylglycerophosphatase A
MKYATSNLKEKLSFFFATGCYIGLIDIIPGTVGSAAALVLCFVFSFLKIQTAFVGIFFFILFSILVADVTEKITKKKDPGCVVIDEYAGMLITFLGIQFTWASAIWGFFIFRFFDILKPFPIRTIERKLPGGAGVVLDDVLAGVFSNITLRIILFLFYAS